MFYGFVGLGYLPKAGIETKEDAAKTPDEGTAETDTLGKSDYIKFICSSVTACALGFVYILSVNTAFYNANPNLYGFKFQMLGVRTVVFSTLLIAVSGIASSTALQVPDDLECFTCCLSALSTIGIIGIILGFLHILGVYSTKDVVIKGISAASILFALVVIVISGIVFVKTFTKLNGNDCDEDSLASLHKDYLASIGCPNKYKATSWGMNELTCLKSDIKFVWETNFEQMVSYDDNDEYGCINHDCCSLVLADLKGIVWTVAIAGFILAISLILAGMKGLTISADNKIEQDPYLKKAIGPLIILAIVLFCCMIFFYPKINFSGAPDVEHYLEADEIPDLVDEDDLGKFEDLITEEFTKRSFPLTNYTLMQQQSNCDPNCDDFVYYVSVDSAAGGKLIFDNDAYSLKKVLIDKDIMRETNGQSLKFKCYFKDVNKMLHYINYVPGDIMKSDKVVIDIKARYETEFDEELDALWGGDRRRRLDNDFYSNENPFYPIFKREISFGFVNKDHFTVYSGSLYARGNIKGDYKKLSGVKIEGNSPQFDDRTITETYTNEEGDFNLTAPIVVDENGELKAYMLDLTFEKDGYLPITSQLTVGGYGFIKDYKLGGYIMNPKRVSKTLVNITGIVIDTNENEPVERAEVNLDSDDEDTENEEDITDSDGMFEFNLTKHCGEEIEAKKKGYYDYEDLLYCEEDENVDIVIPLTPIIEGYSLRTVLTWEGPNNDLDLHVKFIKSRTVECKVGFSFTRCGGAEYWGDYALNKSDPLQVFETLDLNDIGPYQYIFYVEDYKPDKNITLEDSEAHVELYSGYEEDGPIIELDVPKVNIK